MIYYIYIYIYIYSLTARKHVSWGYRNKFIRDSPQTCLSNEYIQLYEQDHFSAATMTAGDELAQALTVEQRKTWQTLIENTDMTHNIKKAWSLIKKLSNDPRKSDQQTFQRNTKSSCTSTHSKWQGTKQTATEQDQAMRPRKPRRW